MNNPINIVNTNLKVSIVALCIRSGARYIDTRKEGLPHLAEHLFLYSKERQKAERLVEFESLGFIYNARTGKEFVNFYIVCKPGFEQQALDLLIDSSRSIMITQSALDKEKLIVNTEIGSTSPLDKLLQVSEAKLWSGSSLSNSILGTLSSVNSINLDEINEYIKSEMTKNKIIPIIISNRNILLKDNNYQDLSAISRTILTPQNSVDVSCKDGYIVLSIALPSMTQLEQQALDYIAYTLAGSWTSILLTKLRHESHLVYWINYKIRFHSDSTTLHLIIRTNSQNEAIVAQDAKEIVFNHNTYSHKFINIMKGLTNSYKIKQLIRSTNPYETLVKVMEILSVQNGAREYSFDEVPRSEVIFQILNRLCLVVKSIGRSNMTKSA